jgi:hypothetical protein
MTRLVFPSVIGAATDLHTAIKITEAKFTPVIGYELIGYDWVGRLKMPKAFFKISRSVSSSRIFFCIATFSGSKVGTDDARACLEEGESESLIHR